METVRVTDAVRCLLQNVPKGPNLACPKGSLLSAKEPGHTTLWRETLARRRDRITIVSWDGLRLSGLVSARTRAGRRVWEVDRLYGPSLPNRVPTNGRPSNESPAPVFLALLEELVQAVGSRDCERVLVRLPWNSPIVDLVRRAGFFPYFEESLLEGRLRGSKPDGLAPTGPLQERLPQDDYPLFQLFCAATPQPVRVGLGLTFDQWRDAQERQSQATREWVLQYEDRITGWLRLRTHQGVEEGIVMAHPDHPDSLQTIIQAALARNGLHKWLVPDYQEMERTLLLRRGFRETARYTALIKTLAAPVTRPGMAAVEA